MRTIAFMLGALAFYSAVPATAQDGAESEGESEPEAESESGAESEPEAESESGAESESEAESESGAGADCMVEPVVLRRFGAGEPLVVRLTDCEDVPNPKALELVSVLAQPHVASSAQDAAATAVPRLLNPELLVRLQQVAIRFPGRPIEIVSGYRTRARPSSRHRSGDALDVRIDGIDNEELSLFARTLEATGVGHYPNSTFVHIDVRETAAYWVDRSGPGQKPEYVRTPEQVHGPELPVESSDEGSAAAGPEGAAQSEVTARPDAIVPDALALPEGFEAEVAAELAEPAPVEAGVPEPQAGEPDAAELAAELDDLAERALIVMQQAGAAG